MLAFASILYLLLAFFVFLCRLLTMTTRTGTKLNTMVNLVMYLLPTSSMLNQRKIIILYYTICVTFLICHKVLRILQQQPFNGRLSGTTRVGWYQKKHSPAHTHPGQHTSFITFLHLQRSTISSLFSLRARQSSRTTSFQVLFGLPLGLEPSTSYSMHFFTNHHLFAAHAHTNAACSAAISMLSSTRSLSLSSLLGSLSFSLVPHIHLTILISAR